MITTHTKTAVQAGDVRNHHGHLMTFRVTNEQTNGTFALIDIILRRGCEPPKHLHEREDELFFIQEGVMRFTIGERIIDAKAGDTVFLPRMIPHAFEVVTPTAKALLYLTPGQFEGFFYELSEEAPEGVLPPAPQGPPPAEAVQAIMEASARYGIQYA
ncbi:cupin domain-containing protein [Larkinella sp. VNQ87]|uniref:cupin domain-containing protein n=1 Tax=Larkinella sp. VNQ87 TaxID=3400921 RepID=UPI003BFC8392